MLEISTFGQCLQKLMLEHQLSASGMAALLGGRAFLKRILQEEASAAKRDEAFAKLADARVFPETDLSRLSEALVVSRIGVEAYQFQRAIHYVLTGTHLEPLTIRPLHTNEGVPLEERLASLWEADRIEILCLNACSHALFSVLAPLFEDQKRNIRLRHYIHADAYANIAANFIAVVYPLLFDPRYEPYGIMRTTASPHYMGGNLFAVQAEIGGVHTEHFYVVSNNQIAYEMPKAAAGDMYAYIRTIIEGITPAPYAIKESVGHAGSYASLYMGHFSHELNRATYSITSGLLLQQVPSNIVVAAFKEKQALPPKEMEELIRTVAPIHEQRYQNHYRKRKPTYCAITLTGCRQFLRDGRLTEFFGFRPFTPLERKCIFGEMLKQARENPYNKVFLVKESTYENRFTVVCYDKLGIAVDCTDTDYRWDANNHSIFLNYPEFTRQFLDFYMHTLIPERCLSEAESLRTLEALFADFLTEFGLDDK